MTGVDVKRAIGGCDGRPRSCGESSVPLSSRSPMPANRPSIIAPVEAWSTLEAVSGTPSLHSDGFKLIAGASDVKSVTTAGRLEVRARRRRNSGFPVQDRMPKVDRSRFIRQLAFDGFRRTAKQFGVPVPDRVEDGTVLGEFHDTILLRQIGQERWPKRAPAVVLRAKV